MRFNAPRAKDAEFNQRLLSQCEADVDDVPIFDNVLFAFQPEGAMLAGLGHGARRHQVGVGNHLRKDVVSQGEADATANPIDAGGDL